MDRMILASTGLPAGKAVSVMLHLHLSAVKRADPRKVVDSFRKRALGLLSGWRAVLLRAYPAAEVHVLEAGGHHPALLHTDEYRWVVKEFLSKQHRVREARLAGKIRARPVPPWQT